MERQTTNKQGRTRLTKNRATMKRTVKTLSVRVRAVVGFALITTLIATTAILAQRTKRTAAIIKDAAGQNSLAATGAAKSIEKVSPEELTSPSLYSKEYIRGPGGRIIATQERVVFTDVNNGTDFFDDIYRIAARGVTVGCTTTTFCPDDTVLRDQMAVFIERALGVFNAPTPTMQHFTDVPPDHWAYAFIEDFATRNITSGCTATTYCPGLPVTHEQMAKFIIRARGEPDPPWPTQQRFSDVPIDHSNPFANFIERMGYLDIWHGQGCPQGSVYYCPGAPVTRTQMAHILVKAFGI